MLLSLCRGVAGTTLSCDQVHHTYVVSLLLPHPARCRHVQTGRSLSRDHVQQSRDHVHSSTVQLDVQCRRRRRREQTVRGRRQRVERHVSSCQYSVHSRTDLPHVLDLRYECDCLILLKPQSNRPLYSNTVIGTLVVDGWAPPITGQYQLHVGVG